MPPKERTKDAAATATAPAGAGPWAPDAASWPGWAVVLQHPAVAEDPAVLLRLLATSRALGAAAAAAAAGRLRLTLWGAGDLLGCWGNHDVANELQRRRLCQAQAAFVERRGALLAELVVPDRPSGAFKVGAWHYDCPHDHEDRPIELTLAPALRRAAAAGRLAGLRALEVTGFCLEGGFLGALAQCSALTRLRLGHIAHEPTCVYIFNGPPSSSAKEVGTQLAALRGLRELELAFGSVPIAAPALAGLSALTALTRLHLALTGLDDSESDQPIELTREWSGLHLLPVSLRDLHLQALCQSSVGEGVERLYGAPLPWEPGLLTHLTRLTRFSTAGCKLAPPNHPEGLPTAGGSLRVLELGADYYKSRDYVDVYTLPAIEALLAVARGLEVLFIHDSMLDADDAARLKATLTPTAQLRLEGYWQQSEQLTASPAGAG